MERGRDDLVLKASRWVFDRARLRVVVHRDFKIRDAHCPHDGAGSLNMTPARCACLRYAARRGCGMHRKCYMYLHSTSTKRRPRNVCDLINLAARCHGPIFNLPAFRPHLHSRARLETHTSIKTYVIIRITHDEQMPLADISHRCLDWTGLDLPSCTAFNISREATRNLKHVRTAAHKHRIEHRRNKPAP